MDRVVDGVVLTLGFSLVLCADKAQRVKGYLVTENPLLYHQVGAALRTALTVALSLTLTYK